MASSSGDGNGKRKREPDKRCVVMYCNNTNNNGVSLHQFPKDKKIRQKWIEFVVRKRDPKLWTWDSGHICSDHFEHNDFENYYAKMSGLCSKLVLRKEAVPSIQPPPRTSTDSEQQQEQVDFRNKKLIIIIIIIIMVYCRVSNKVRFFIYNIYIIIYNIYAIKNKNIKKKRKKERT